MPDALPPRLFHSRITVSRYYALHAAAAVFPLTAGIVLYGPRAALALGLVCGSAAAATALWRRVGQRGGQLLYSHVLWLALLLAMMLPAQLAAHAFLSLTVLWPLLPAAGVLLATLCWLLGGVQTRIHPALITYLALIPLYGSALVPTYVLQRNAAGVGDLANAPHALPAVVPQESWLHRPIIPGHDALAAEPAAATLTAYTTGRTSPDRAWLALDGMLRDRLPPLEDLILGAQPGPLGAGSAIAVIIGGLFLLYHRLIDYRLPLLTVVSAFLLLLLLPVPSVITDQPHWRWMVGSDPSIGWAVGITLANYELLASPLLFTAFFLATAGGSRPLTRRGQAVYAIVLGALAAVGQLYLSAAYAPYLAALAASCLTPALDRWFHPRPLV